MLEKQKINATTYLIAALLISSLLVVYLINDFAVKLLVLLLIIAGVYILFLIQKKQNEKLLQKQSEFYNLKSNLLQSSLDPHFLFNALNSVSFSIHKDSHDTAISNLTTFSKLMRISLNNIDKFGHELSEEIDFIKNYLTLEKFRFKDQFDYTIKIQPYVNDMVKVPAFGVFCFVENALKKGVLSRQGGGQITIEVDKNPTNKELVISILDNGVYRDLTDSENFTHNINVVNTLIGKINAINERQIRVSYSVGSEQHGEKIGCKVEMRIPTELSYKLTADTF